MLIKRHKRLLNLVSSSCLLGPAIEIFFPPKLCTYVGLEVSNALCITILKAPPQPSDTQPHPLYLDQRRRLWGVLWFASTYEESNSEARTSTNVSGWQTQALSSTACMYPPGKPHLLPLDCLREKSPLQKNLTLRLPSVDL